MNTLVSVAFSVPLSVQNLTESFSSILGDGEGRIQIINSWTNKDNENFSEIILSKNFSNRKTAFCKVNTILIMEREEDCLS